ncbi:MAG: hypothetical protein AAFV29_21900, partial [Myxococcota bacterium]
MSLIGCSSKRQLTPPIPSDTRVALWAVDTGVEWRVDVSTIDASTPWRFSDPAEDGTAVAVLAYRSSLLTLGMTTGPQISVDDPSARTRPLPSADALLFTEIGQG